MATCGYSVASIILEICERAGLDPRMVNVNAIEEIAKGFAMTNQYPAAGAIQALAQIFFFDGASYDGRINFVKRGANSVFNITEDQLVDDDKDIEQQKRADPIAIPRVLNLNYFDVLGGMTTDKQTSERAGDRRANGEAQLVSAVVMDANEAARVLHINHKIMAEDQNGEFRFCIPDSFIGITPADCGFLSVDGWVKRVRVNSVSIEDGYQEVLAVCDRQSSYESAVEGYPAAGQSYPPAMFSGPTLLEILDIHILRDSDDNQGLIYYVAVSGVEDSWSGAVVDISFDGGQSYQDSANASNPSTMGELTTVLGDHPQEFPDQVHTCRVRIDSIDQVLEATDLAGLQRRENLALIGDEIVNFADADEVEPGIWEIGYFLRGRKGTNPVSHPIGTRFVLLDSFAPIPASVTDLGRAITFRATSFGNPVDEATVKTITYQGRSQIEREVAYLEAHRSGVNAVVTWQGVGRLGAGETVAQGARFTGYRVRFDDGTNPIVSVDTTNQTLTQDVSALGAPLTISVVQVNGLTGEGPETEITIP